MTEQDEKLGTFPYVIGGMSFIPLIGVLFGLIAIVWGITTRKHGGNKLILTGGAGIAFTVIIYSSLFYFGFVQRGGIYDDLRAELSKSTITQLVQAIEFYKTQNGEYPDSLETLRKSLPENAMVYVFDPTHVQMNGKPRYFHYELKDPAHYYLLGVGSDEQPFTRDDVLPNIEVKANSGIGLIIHEETKSD